MVVQQEKLMIVEGSSDKKRISRLLDEPIEILCTNGTVSPYRLEEMLEPYEQWDIYVFVDADESGEKIRSLFRREFPSANHLYTEKIYREVATTPNKVLIAALLKANIKVRSEYLQ
jgi:toprim domain protein